MYIEKQVRFKVIIDIDGNTYSGRFPRILSTGSAIIKIYVFDDIATLSVQPWIHYIPVKFDLSDLK